MFAFHNFSRMKRKWMIGLGAVLALNASLWIVQVAVGTGLPRPLAAYFLGPRMVRAEVITKDTLGVHDYRLDAGRVRAVSGNSLTLHQRTGDTVTIAVASGASITLGGVPTTLSSLRKGMQATTIREDGAPATRVIATRR